MGLVNGGSKIPRHISDPGSASGFSADNGYAKIREQAEREKADTSHGLKTHGSLYRRGRIGKGICRGGNSIKKKAELLPQPRL